MNTPALREIAQHRTAAWALLGLMVAPIVIWALEISLPQFVPPQHVIPFHTLVELFAVVVAILIFATGYHVSDRFRLQASAVLACSFLAVGILDTLHLLTYPGMPDFVNENTPHQTIAFWLAARLAAAFGLLAYVLVTIRTTEAPHPGRTTLLLGALLATAAISALLLLRPEWVPATYAPNTGLTPFKILTEWFVILVHLATLAVIARQWSHLPRTRFRLIVGALLLIIGSELFFTLYADLTDSHFVLGHVYKVFAYILLYLCMVVETVRQPMEQLDQALHEIREKEQRFQELIDGAPDGVVVTNERDEITLANRQIRDLFGYAPVDLIGAPLDRILPEDPPENAWIGNGIMRPSDHHECRIARRVDGTCFPVEISQTRSEDSHGTWVTTFLRDVTERLHQEEALHFQATHDRLSGLPNRWHFRDRMEHDLERLERELDGLAVLVLDLDDFKEVNDRHGHLVGDDLIVAVAERLQAQLRATDTVARLGGDEFAILLPGVVDAENAERIAQQIVDSLTVPFELEAGIQVRTGASVGISFAPTHGKDTTTLLRCADVAMYQAKSRKAERSGQAALYDGALDNG